VNAPNSKVYIDGRYAGDAAPGSPLNQRNLFPGEVTVRVEAEGYAPVTRRAEVAMGKWTQESVRLNRIEQKAWLVVRSNVNHDMVYIGDLAVGPTGPEPHTLKPGEYRVRVEKGGRAPWEERITLAAGETRTLQAQLGTGPRRQTGIEPDMVFIEGGAFQMGSPTSESGRDDDERRHRVEVKGFRIGKTEVTVAEFRRFVKATGYRTDADKNAGGKDGCWAYDQDDSDKRWNWRSWANWRKPNKSQKNRDDHAVSCVSWNDAMAYIEWLNGETGGDYRLPTEAEWEYAARGGTMTARYWGENPDRACQYANVTDQTKLPNGNVWTNKHECKDGYAFVAPVARFRPNEFGLYDMLGNLWERTCSNYDEGYGGSEKECVSNKHASGRRVGRGGSWYGRPRGGSFGHPLQVYAGQPARQAGVPSRPGLMILFPLFFDPLGVQGATAPAGAVF
ncbi:MAG: formylglycine-generating enzyme family protein, partial [Pseudomonadota bacterium]|nr:formylglycine-generating enzyme family protein [Pseudomonadota bacterium]